jgi:hypothetical protein
MIKKRKILPKISNSHKITAMSHGKLYKKKKMKKIQLRGSSMCKMKQKTSTVKS